MDKQIFNKSSIQDLIKKVFPKSTIKKYKKFNTGLVGSTFKVWIQNPSKEIVVKFSDLKNSEKINKNNKILKYLKENKILAPQVFLNETLDKTCITVMECIKGKTASKVYNKSNKEIKKTILKNSGKILQKIHSLKIPKFWIHQKHEIKNKTEWKEWTLLRIKKYLKFYKKNLNINYDYLKKVLDEFWNILEKEKIDFVPLHWDYHLNNISVNDKGKITGIFDFDNSLKGHNLADLGQFKYWIIVEDNDPKLFDSFLKGYKNKFTDKELKLIHGYYLLHLLAVTRSIWDKQPKLTWLVKKHQKMLEQI